MARTETAEIVTPQITDREGLDTDDLDPDSGFGGDTEAGAAAIKEQTQLVAQTKHMIAWRPVGPLSAKTFEPRKLQRNNWKNDYAPKRFRMGVNKGKRTFWLESQLPEGWKQYGFEARYRCPIAGCGKKFPARMLDTDAHGLLALRGHLRFFHEHAYESLYKEQLEAKIKTDVTNDAGWLDA